MDEGKEEARKETKATSIPPSPLPACCVVDLSEKCVKWGSLFVFHEAADVIVSRSMLKVSYLTRPTPVCSFFSFVYF